MKILLTSLLLFAGCGSTKNNDTTTKPDAPELQSLAVTTVGEIPDCAESNQKQLVYVITNKEFFTCQGTLWERIEIVGAAGPRGEAGSAGAAGQTGADGMSISSIENLSSGINDLCTRYSNDSCAFTGGLTTKYSNGLVQFGGHFYFYYSFDDAGDFDSDSYQSSSAITTCKPTDSSCWVFVDTIQRTGSDAYRSLWLVYTTATKKFHLVYDTDNDYVYEATDEVIEELTKSSAYVE